ncbi:MAG: AI-2E family transporter [Eubacterium sp.]|nr:AI-2E family transporter [Eubacterium sp.]MDD7210333.1 AI-2E family transporter [Lachnospiraceae bacterium]MDY5496887.1 AI-2E family transporter [Anaerobutyricum sp.]
MKGENKKYIKLGITGALVIASGILCAFLVFKMPVIVSGLRGMIGIVKPFIYGAVIAYLLTPLCNRLEGKFYEWIPEKNGRARKMIPFFSVVLSLVFAVAVVWMLFLLIIPQVWDSTVKIVNMLPGKVVLLNDWIDSLLKNQPELQTYFENFSTKVEEYVNGILGSNMIRTAQQIFMNLSSQILAVFGVFKNMVLGFLISAYLLASRKRFAAQAKLILRGAFPDKWADVIEEEVYYADKMFNGFFVGKIIDSAIIGLLCFAGTTAMGFEAAAFISVVIGITNIIPFFGPFIGAVPCSLLLLLDNPLHCLYFIIFIIVLQQIDGNVIGPKILGNTTGVSSFWVLFAILLFGGLWGMTGMIIGVPLFAVLYDMVRKLVFRGLKKHNHEDMGKDYRARYHGDEL